MNKIVKLLFLLPILILAVVVVIGAIKDVEKKSDRQIRPSIGEPARDFTYPGLDGKDVSLSDFFGKKVVFVNVWATWCTECRKELPTVQSMYETICPSDDIVPLGVA